MVNLREMFKSDVSNMLDVIFTARAEELSGLIEKDIDTIDKTAKQTVVNWDGSH